MLSVADVNNILGMQDLFVRTQKQWAVDFQNEFHVLSPHELSPQNFSDVYLSINDFDGFFHEQLKNCAAQYGVKLENQRILFKKISATQAQNLVSMLLFPDQAPIKLLLHAARTEDMQISYLLGQRLLFPLFKDKFLQSNDRCKMQAALWLEHAALNGHEIAGQLLGRESGPNGVLPAHITLSWAIKTLPSVFLYENIIGLLVKHSIDFDDAIVSMLQKIQVNLKPRERACVFCFVNNIIENLLLSKKTEDKQLAESLIRLLPEKQIRVWLLVEFARWRLHVCGDTVSAARYLIAFLSRMADRIDPEWGANYAERLMWFDRVKKDLETLCLSKEISNEQRIELAQFMCGPFSLASMQADLMTYTIASIKNAPDDKLSKKEVFRYRQYAKILETADVVPAEYKKELEQLLACIKSF